MDDLPLEARNRNTIFLYEREANKFSKPSGPAVFDEFDILPLQLEFTYIFFQALQWTI